MSTTILTTLAGSHAHGIDTPTSDYDYVSVVVAPLDTTLGISPEVKTKIVRDAPEGVRASAGDVEHTTYELRHFLKLATQGNPNILVSLFCAPQHVVSISQVGGELRAMAPSIVSQQALRRHLGYLDAQYGRMKGEGPHQSRKPNRPELVKAHGYDCYLDDTEFLTRHGWLRYDDIDDGEELATIDAEGSVEFQLPSARVAKSYSGSILVGKTRYSSWAVTPNHRMWVSKVERGPSGVNGTSYVPERASWGFRTAESVSALLWHQRVAGAPRTKEYSVSDSYLALVGAYVSEGCPAKRLQDGSVSVLAMEQKDGGRLHAVMDVVSAEYPLRTYRYPKKRPVTKFTLSDRELAQEITETCGVGEHNKKLPSWVFDLSTRQAEVLLWALLSGDGTPYRSGGWVYYTASQRLAGDVQALALLAGRRSLQWGPYTTANMYQVFIADPESAHEVESIRPARSVEEIEVTNRRIVCFTVPNERLVTRRNGRVAMHGNTKYAAHALRLAWQGTELAAFGKLILPLRPDLREALLQIRAGEWPEMLVRERIEHDRGILREYVNGERHTSLPGHPDYRAINKWLIRTQLETT